MGLDIYHLKVRATPTPLRPDACEEYHWHFTSKELRDEDRKILRFEERCRNIEEMDILQTTYLVDSDTDAAKLEKLQTKVQIIIVPDASSREAIQPHVGELEARIDAAVDRSEAWRPTLTDNAGQIVRPWEVTVWGWVQNRALFFDQVGYQRKQMSPSFYVDFQADFCSAMQQDFERLALYIKESAPPEVQHNIDRNFRANFVNGESLLVVSW